MSYLLLYVLPNLLVVQAALFIGFLSPFLPELLRRLEPDPMDIIQDVLIYQTRMMRNSSLESYVPADFSPPDHIVIVNVLFYASLGVIVLAAFIALLIKSWVREFDRGLWAMSIPEQRAKTREFRYLGMERWKLAEMIEILPLLFQISLLLFAIGLAIFLFNISTSSFGVIAAIFGIGVFYYAVTTSISVFATSSPFQSPPSRALRRVYQHVHAYLCPPVEIFLSESMDTTPITPLGRFHRRIQISLLKSRPYLERDFEKPMSATTVDEVHLSTAASALQRIHDSAPNSQHSEALHWSVWHVAGSPAHRMSPTFNLPYWIVYKENSEEYFSRLPPDMVAALSVVWMRDTHAAFRGEINTLMKVVQRADNPKVRCAQLAAAMRYFSLDDFTNMIKRVELNREDTLLLLSMLSELNSWERLSTEHIVQLCRAILLDAAPQWTHFNPPDILLLESVVTLAGTTPLLEWADTQRVITSSRERPWLLLNIRNPALFSEWFERIHSIHHRQFISLLFLVVYALMHRHSIPLADQYFTIILEKGDLPLYTSALAAIAPSIDSDGLAAIARVLLAPGDVTSIITDFMRYEESYAHVGLLKAYDLHLRASATQDPNLFAILLMLSKTPSSNMIWKLQYPTLEIKDPWLNLVARMVARMDISDELSLPIGLCYDHRLHNMFAALSLLQYTTGEVTEFLLPSFLQSREFSITSIALEYYIKTRLSYSDPSAPSRYLSGAVHGVFNLMLPDHQLRRGWAILEVFVDKFGDLPMEWSRTFAEGFFTLSRQPLPQSQGETETTTPERELENILTWGYFHADEQESEFTDSEFSGLDWMAMAWSLQLAQQSGRKKEGSRRKEAQSQGLSVPALTEEFVLRTLFKLLDAAPNYQIIPIIAKLREFVQWFDGDDLLEYCCMISARVEEIVRRQNEVQMLHKFHKFHCMWYM